MLVNFLLKTSRVTSNGRQFFLQLKSVQLSAFQLPVGKACGRPSGNLLGNSARLLWVVERESLVIGRERSRPGAVFLVPADIAPGDFHGMGLIQVGVAAVELKNSFAIIVPPSVLPVLGRIAFFPDFYFIDPVAVIARGAHAAGKTAQVLRRGSWPFPVYVRVGFNGEAACFLCALL